MLRGSTRRLVRAARSGARCFSGPPSYETSTLAANSNAAIGALETALEYVHVTSGMPWWASLATVTAGMRMALLPLTAVQMKNAANMERAKPEVQQLVERTKSENVKGDQEAAMRYRRELANIWKRHQCHPLKGLLPGLAQVPVFMSFFYAVRDMAQLDSFRNGGALFFEDLASPSTDPYYALPIISSSLMIATVELGGPDGATMSRRARLFMRGFAGLLVPLTATLPKGLFVYWITTNVASVFTTLAFQRLPLFRRLIGAPARGSSPSSSASSGSESASSLPTSEQLLANRPSVSSSAGSGASSSGSRKKKHKKRRKGKSG